MSSSFWPLWGDSRGFSQGKKKYASKAEQIHKMTTIFTPKDNLGPFWLKTVVSLWICKAFESSSFFLSMRKITWLNSQQPKTRGRVEHLGYYRINRKESNSDHCRSPEVFYLTSINRINRNYHIRNTRTRLTRVNLQYDSRITY